MPKFTQRLSDIEIEEDEEIVLMCKVQGKPEPIISWKKELQLLEKSEKIKIFSDNEVQKLIITKANKNHSGTYFCEAQNKAGSSKTSCNVSVTGNANIDPVSDSHCQSLFIYLAPTADFSVKLNDVQVTENGEVSLQCTVTKDKAKTEWFKDGTILKPGRDYEIVESGAERKLIIKSAKLDQSGLYTCASGKRKTSAMVNVVGKLLIL